MLMYFSESMTKNTKFMAFRELSDITAVIIQMLQAAYGKLLRMIIPDWDWISPTMPMPHFTYVFHVVPDKVIKR